MSDERVAAGEALVAHVTLVLLGGGWFGGVAGPAAGQPGQTAQPGRRHHPAGPPAGQERVGAGRQEA